MSTGNPNRDAIDINAMAIGSLMLFLGLVGGPAFGMSTSVALGMIACGLAIQVHLADVNKASALALQSMTALNAAIIGYSGAVCSSISSGVIGPAIATPAAFLVLAMSVDVHRTINETLN